MHNSNSDMSGADETTLYLLDMGSSLNLRTDSQVFPLQILNNSETFNYNKLFLPTQIKDDGQDQVEVVMDGCHESAVKFVTLQVENSCQQGKELLLSTCHTQNATLSSSLHISPQEVHYLENDNELTRTDLISPLINDEQTLCLPSKKQIQNYVHVPDRSVLPRAIAVLPTILQIRQKEMISARRTLLPRTRFGPIQGIKHKMSLEEANNLLLVAESIKKPLFILRDKDQIVVHIDVSDKDKANWISLLPLGDQNSANVWIYEENSELYIITTETVPSRKQLMLGYSKKYAQDYGLTGPTKDIDTGFPLNPKTWWCYECQRAMPSAYQLQRHMNAHHQTDKTLIRRQAYRCRYCTRKFSRIFTLRRHMARHCEKKPKKSENIINTETLPEVILNTSLNSEDNRVPSDESFQNYSNGLDFSTNLFDTDRMPSLDISGNSRSEVFNPYGLVSENALSNDLEYTNGCSNKIDDLATNSNEENQLVKKTEASRESCTYCNQNVAKGKKRQHVSECPARRFECECKKVFTSKELLTLHYYSEHSTKPEAEQQEQNDANITTNAPVPDNKTYLCEQCQHSFKRRGMLVNHLWRVHNTVSARVPLERRVRHYPCGSCPKIYRTAAKRERHVRVHHPGAENIRVKEIEGGTRECAPAKCGECPRQYATRAKLLQHQRQHHPYMVPTTQKKTNSKQHTDETNVRVNTSEELLRNKTSLQQLLNFY